MDGCSYAYIEDHSDSTLHYRTVLKILYENKHMNGHMYTPMKNGGDAISIQLALVYSRISGQDFRFLRSFVSVRLLVLGDISVHADEYPLSGQQLVRIYDCCKLG